MEQAGRPGRGVDAEARALKRRFSAASVIVAVGLFAGMLLFLEVGRQIGLLLITSYGANARHGVGVVDGVVFSLTALLLGFAFSGATSRFDQRRQLVVNEVSAAGTVWQRIGALPPDWERPIRDLFRRYLDELAAWYSEAPGAAATLAQAAGLSRAQDDLWSRSLEACLTPEGEKARMLLLPAMNDLFGAVDKERLARRMHPPRVIYALLIVAGMASGLFGGYALAGGTTRPWVYMLGVAAAIAMTMFVIFQLEFPRLGMMGLGDMDAALVELRVSMNRPSIDRRPPSGHAAA